MTDDAAAWILEHLGDELKLEPWQRTLFDGLRSGDHVLFMQPRRPSFTDRVDVVAAQAVLSLVDRDDGQWSVAVHGGPGGEADRFAAAVLARVVTLLELLGRPELVDGFEVEVYRP